MLADDDDLPELKARLLELNQACDAVARARRLLAEARGAQYPDSGQPSGYGELSSAVTLAQKRLARATATLERATFRLTGGTPLHEVLWSLPDGI